MKKFSNGILIIILVLLAGAFALSRFFRAPGLEGNLRKELVNLDTADVTELRVLASNHPEDEITLRREGFRWKVLKGKEEAETDDRLVKGTLGMLTRIQPQRVISYKKEKWDDYEVGERGTHVSVYEKSGKMADFVVGKTGFAQATGGAFGGGYTYIRVSSENEVYEVEGFFQSAFKRAFNDWRDKTLLHLTRENITKLIFRYPLDSGFVAEKKDSLWYVLPLGVNRSFMQNYLGQVSRETVNEFENGFVPPRPADAVLEIEGKTGILAKVEGWKTETKWVLTSTQQKGIYFSSPEQQTIRNLFIGKNQLLK